MKRATVQNWGGPEVITVTESDIPEPQPHQVLIKVHAVGVNPLDTYVRSGQYAKLPQLPWTPGKDGSGIIEKVGVSNSTDSDGYCHRTTSWMQPGARVWTSIDTSGLSAQYALVDKNRIFQLPDHLTFHQGAAIGIAFRTAYKALIMVGKAKAAQSLLVHGASGGVGLAIVQLAKALGMYPIIGTAGTDGGMKVVEENGADYVLNHREEKYMEKLNTISELRNRPVKNKGVDLIIEHHAPTNFGEDIRYLQKHGTIVIVGSRGMNETSICPRDLMQCEGNIRGVLSWKPEEHDEVYRGVQAAVMSGVARPVVQMPVYKLSELPDAHIEVMEHKRGTQGKIVVDPWL
eukprot:gene801-471_t